MRPSRRAVPVALLLIACLSALPAAAAPPRQDPPPLKYGARVADHIGEDEDGDEWRFAGFAGDLVVADMLALEPGGLDTYLTLVDPQGNALVNDDDGGEGYNARLGPFLLPMDGDYRIVAGHYSGGGDYMLVLQNLNTAPVISLDKPVIGTIDAGHVTDYFLLEPHEGASAALWRVALADQAHVTLALYGPEGLVTTTENQGGSLDAIVAAPGASYALVLSWNYASGGAYELTLTASDVALLEHGAVHSGTLDFDTEQQRHYFQAEQGDLVRVTLSGDAPIAPAMTVATLDDSQFIFSNDGAGTAEVSALLHIPASTVYTVDVRDSSYLWQTGSYRLSLEWVSDAGAP